MRQHNFTQQTKQVGIKWKHLTSQTAKKCSVSVCWKGLTPISWNAGVSHAEFMPQDINECLLLHTVLTVWSYSKNETWTCLGCDLATQEAKLRQYMSDTNIAVTSLGTSGPSTLQSRPSHIRLLLVSATKQHMGRCWFQNKEEEEIQEQLQIQKPDFYHDWLLKFTHRLNKCINAVRNYTEN